MGFDFVFLPGGKKRKYEGKAAKMAYKDMKHQRRADKHQHVNDALSGNTNHDMPWWREPTLASLIGRFKK